MGEMSLQIQCMGNGYCLKTEKHYHGAECSVSCHCLRGKPEPAARHMTSSGSKPSAWELFKARGLARRFL